MFQKAISNFTQQHSYSSLCPKAFFFDMDGVIFDSMPYHAKSWVKAFEEIGIKFSEYKAYLNEGRTGASTIANEFLEQKKRNATETEIQQLYKIKSHNFEKCGDPIPMPYAPQVLQKTKSLGIDIFLVTGSGQSSLLQTLNTFYPGIFSPDKMVTAYDVKHGKPHPEPYLMALEKANIKPNEAFVIENAPLGIQSAVAANIFTIGVNTGILDEKELIQAGTNLIFNSMQDFYLQMDFLLDCCKKR